MSMISSSYTRDINGENDNYERERDRPLRLDATINDKSTLLPPVATLLNLGNTCFLNSVLYTLRFTPGFAHLLHHLAADLADKKLLSTIATNERKIGFLSSGSPGLRTKSLSSLCPSSNDENILPIDPIKRKTLVLTERLHELLQTLHNAEQKGDLSEPFQADAFLQALREVNPLFQGNQQQDAHELLVCFLDYLREACQLVDRVHTTKNASENNAVLENGDSATLKRGKQQSEKKKKGKKMFAAPDKDKDGKKGKRNLLNSQQVPSPTVQPDQTASVTGEETVASVANDAHTRTRDFISESFEGVTVLRTTCLECEHVTERKESFMDICVPIINENMLDEPPLSPSAFYASMLMEVDFLRDSNKYWCEQCVRYNEARRSVHYEKLPRLLVLQLKRFSLSYGSTVHTSKVNDYMPTPMQLDCFCEHCQASPEAPLHSYKLYAIIMHLGATMASGHYVAYTRVCPSTADYAACSRSKAATAAPSAVFSNSRSSSDRNSNHSGGSAGGLLRFFKPKSSSSLGTESLNNSGNNSPLLLCRSVNCCSARPRKLIGDSVDKEKERDSSGRESPASASSSNSTYNLPDDVWLECDDEVIRVLRMRELEDLLSRKPRASALTPYLLFYVQVTPPIIPNSTVK